MSSSERRIVSFLGFDTRAHKRRVVVFEGKSPSRVVIERTIGARAVGHDPKWEETCDPESGYRRELDRLSDKLIQEWEREYLR